MTPCLVAAGGEPSTVTVCVADAAVATAAEALGALRALVVLAVRGNV